jgi:hypothetical protein
MSELGIASSWTTMDRGIASGPNQAAAHYPFYVRLARELTESEAAQCLLGAGDHREMLD